MFNISQRHDWSLITLLLGLFALGLVALYSAGGETRFIAQLWRGLFGIALMLGLACLPLRWLEYAIPAIFLVVLATLLLVLGVGEKINNARRWLNIGFLVQPSEFMKLVLPLGLAFCYSRMERITWYHHLLMLALIAPPVWLVMQQPDLGTALMIAAAGTAVVFFAGIGWRWIISFMVLGVALLPILWSWVLKPYQQKRVLTMFDPYKDPLGTGYHTIQSEIAIGSGGIWGKGLLGGSQAQLGFLPERHTDFIFAVYAEEFGLVGSAGLLTLTLLITWRCLLIAGRATSRFGHLAAAGITAVFFMTMSINLCMVSGLLPVVGMPLPLISYGGTALIATFAGFGLILAVARR